MGRNKGKEFIHLLMAVVTKEIFYTIKWQDMENISTAMAMFIKAISLKTKKTAKAAITTTTMVTPSQATTPTV